MAESGPDTVDFVGSNADADTCAADEDAPVESAVSNGFSDFLGNVRIIAAFARQGAVIGEFNALFLQIFFDVFFQVKSAVIGAEY